MSITNKRRVFIEEYLKDFNATQAAIRCGYSLRSAYSQGQRLLKNDEVLEVIKRRIDEKAMQADEILVGLSEQARGDLGIFFELVEEWTYYPLPTYNIIGAKEIEITDEDGKPTGEKKISYWVRHVTIDMDKVIDPKYSHLIHKFTDSPKNGLGIEIYDKQNALSILGKMRGLYKEKIEITGKDGEPIAVELMRPSEIASTLASLLAINDIKSSDTNE